MKRKFSRSTYRSMIPRVDIVLVARRTTRIRRTLHKRQVRDCSLFAVISPKSSGINDALSPSVAPLDSGTRHYHSPMTGRSRRLAVSVESKVRREEAQSNRRRPGDIIQRQNIERKPSRIVSPLMQRLRSAATGSPNKETNDATP